MLVRLRLVASLSLILLGVPAFGIAASFVVKYELFRFDLSRTLMALSFFASGYALALVALIYLAAAACGQQRHRLATVFLILARLVPLLLAILILMDAVILIAGVALVELRLLNSVTTSFMITIVAAAAFALIEMVSSAFEVVQPVETSVIAVEAEQKAYPLLWDRITKIAAKLGARPPDAVLLGLSPTFFATAATVRLTGTPARLTGESLYLSLPLMRLMSQSEFDAVLGHELGHFLGEDTAYTLRFVPVYQGFARAVLATETESARDALALLPARVVLRYTLSLFARAERAIGREREIAADRCGASVASGVALVGALTKTTLADAAWNRVMMSAIACINRRTPIENLGQAFVECRQLFLSEIPVETLLAKIGEARLPHPTDSHPPVAARAAALGVSLDISLFSANGGTSRAVDLIPDYESIEIALSRRCDEWLLAQGIARPVPLAGRPTAIQRKRDTLAKRAAARRRAVTDTRGSDMAALPPADRETAISDAE